MSAHPGTLAGAQTRVVVPYTPGATVVRTGHATFGGTLDTGGVAGAPVATANSLEVPNNLCPWQAPPAAMPVTRTVAQMEAIINAAFVGAARPHHITPRPLYALPALADFQKFSDIGSVHRMVFHAAVCDCDDFALTLYSNARLWHYYTDPPSDAAPAVGYLLLAGHVKNFFVTDDEGVWAYEPQTDVAALWVPGDPLQAVYL